MNNASNKKQKFDDLKQRIAHVISSVITHNVFNVDEHINEYFDNNMHEIMLEGLGITSNSSNTKWEISTNDKCKLSSIIEHLAKREAEKRAPVIIDKIIENFFSKCKSNKFTNLKQSFSHYYNIHLNVLINEKLNEIKNELSKKMRLVIEETMTQVNIMTAEHLKTLTSNIENLEKNLNKNSAI